MHFRICFQLYAIPPKGSSDAFINYGKYKIQNNRTTKKVSLEIIMIFIVVSNASHLWLYVYSIFRNKAEFDFFNTSLNCYKKQKIMSQKFIEY